MTSILVLGILLAAGLLGAFLIARYLSGGLAWAALLAWLILPFVILGAALVGGIDPTIEAERTQYNLSFGFVLFSILLAVPWLPANLIGALLGRRQRKSGEAD